VNIYVIRQNSIKKVFREENNRSDKARSGPKWNFIGFDYSKKG
jgi:hypothetical protein